jgi:hypothetical protein
MEIRHDIPLHVSVRKAAFTVQRVNTVASNEAFANSLMAAHDQPRLHNRFIRMVLLFVRARSI